MTLPPPSSALALLLYVAGVGGLLAAGCAATIKDPQAVAKGTTKPATTKAATKPSGPVHETIAVDLSHEYGPFVPRAKGLLRPPPSPQFTPAQLAPLGPLADGEPRVRVVLTDAVKFDGAFPGEKSNWAKWDAGVADLANRHKGRPGVTYEIAREPDDKRDFRGADRRDFFSAHVRSMRILKSIDPQAVVHGPSISKYDGGWLQDYVKTTKEYDAYPDVIAWCEDNLKHDVAKHVHDVSEMLWQDGGYVERFAISASNAVAGKYAPSDPAIFMGQMERAVKDNAKRPHTIEFEFKLSHLFTAPAGAKADGDASPPPPAAAANSADLKPRSVFYAWREYANLANAGRAVRVSASPTIDGVAVFSQPQRTARVLIGRNATRVDPKRHTLGKVTFQVKGAAGASVLMKATRIADTGAKPSNGPERTWETELPLKNGEATCPLPDFAPGDAYAIELTVRGAAPTTKPATTTTTTTIRPTPTPAKK